jgi:hypothetical protein
VRRGLSGDYLNLRERDTKWKAERFEQSRAISFSFFYPTPNIRKEIQQERNFTVCGM